MSASSPADAYAVRKLRELCYLEAASGVAVPDAPLTPELVVETKRRCRAELRARVEREGAAGSETNWSGSPSFALGGHRLRAQYQRFDLVAEHEDALEEIYRWPAGPGDRIAIGAYTGSGMAAITAALAGLAALPGPTAILSSSDVYFETIQLVRHHFRALDLRLDTAPHESGLGAGVRRVVWLDAIQRDALDATYPDGVTRREADVVVIDTTCWPLGDPKLADVVARTTSAGVPCLLVRSHLKLDSLGLEYGRLGSLVFACTASLDAAAARAFGALAAASRDAVARMGLNFDPRSLLPFHHDPAFHALNDVRIERIRRNADLLASVLRDSGVPVHHYDHRLFVTLGVSGSTTRVDVSKKKDALAAFLADRGICARAAGSFGFDFVAVDAYHDHATGEERVRISLADLDDADVLVLGRAVAAFSSRAAPRRTTTRKDSPCHAIP